MNLSFVFFFNSILLGIGLAMDAFSVSLANGLADPCMRKRKMSVIAGTFAFFQALMPMIGWVCVHTVVTHFRAFEKFIPWIALALLGYIGGKMLYDGIKGDGEEACDVNKKLNVAVLLVQGIATSIDALSVGFTIAEYNLAEALLAALIIAVVTFAICMVGLLIGKFAASSLSGKATLLGGAVLIFIGIEIFVTGLLG